MPAEQLDLPLPAPSPSLPQLWTPDDIYEPCDQRIIEQFKEDRRVERKTATASQRHLADYLSMWANTNPLGGVIFVGVEDDGSISGCKRIETEHINEIETVRRLCPDARIEFKRVAVTNAKGEDDFVIVIRVHYRDDKLVETVDGNAFVREGDQKRKLTETEKREIRLNKGELDVEAERVTLAFPDDFNSDLLEEYRQQYVLKRNLKDRYSIEDVLALSKLGKVRNGKFEPNLACALLFADDPTTVVPGAFIRIIRYHGTVEGSGRNLNIINDAMIHGALPTQIAAAEGFIEAQIRNFTRLGKDGRFVTNPEYPKDVWREALVNAVVHRSYNLKNMNIFVKLFEDRMVIESPGGFPPPTTAETVFYAHNPRNSKLMWALYYFDYVLCAFEGTRRMRDGMREVGLPDPKFVQRQLGTYQVSVTLENDLQHRKIFVRSEAAAIINPEDYDKLSESEKMIVNYLADRQRVNVTDAGLFIAKGWRETRKVLGSLEKKGIIASIGKYRSRHRHYFLKNKKKT